MNHTAPQPHSATARRVGEPGRPRPGIPGRGRPGSPYFFAILFGIVSGPGIPGRGRPGSPYFFAILSVIALGIARICSAQSTQPTPLLQQLSDETQQLYTQSRHSMVRVQLPTPQWLDQYNQRQLLLQKWGSQLDPQVREKLMEEQERYERALKGVATEPTTGPSGLTLPSTRPTTAGLQVVEGKSVDVQVTLNAVGVVVDDQGHAVLPVYVDRKTLGNAPLPVVTGDGQTTTATFVGSDAQTSLTVIQLASHNGKPVAMGHPKPDDGTLTLVIAPDGTAKLVVWNNQHPEPGFAIVPDGSLGGFGFDKYFLGASTAKPIVDQLIATGAVHRAQLGVWVQEVGRDDALRRQNSVLGLAPAIRVISVLDNSAAARGGVKVNDLVLAVAGQPVGDAPTFAAVIATGSGDTTLKILRGTQMLQLTVNLQPK
jgi:S1-C subfamily serine protease